MEFYAVSKGNIDPRDMMMFGKIQVILGAMPDLVFDPEDRTQDACKNQVSCHLLCRALAKHLDASVHDGYFLRSYQHSWLIPASKTSVIDVYPVAGAVPFIVARDSASPWFHLYQESDRLQEKFITDKFLMQLEQTTQSVGHTIQQLGLV